MVTQKEKTLNKAGQIERGISRRLWLFTLWWIVHKQFSRGGMGAKHPVLYLGTWAMRWCRRHAKFYMSQLLPKWPLQWRHNGHDSVSNHQPHHCLFNRLLGCRSKKRSKLRATGLCVGNSPGTGEFPAQMASNAEKVSIWWRHHDSEYI